MVPRWFCRVSTLEVDGLRVVVLDNVARVPSVKMKEVLVAGLAWPQNVPYT